VLDSGSGENHQREIAAKMPEKYCQIAEFVIEWQV
jgi:hypothetical protein